MAACFLSLLFVNPPASQAGADSPAPANSLRWSAAHPRPKKAPQKLPAIVSGAQLKWGRAASASPRWHDDQGGSPLARQAMTQDGPALDPPQVSRAMHEVDDRAAKGEILLMSFDEPVKDDPAADPFQDEVLPDAEDAVDEEAVDEEAVEADEALPDEEVAFDPDEVAQRDTAPDRSDLSNDLDEDMRSMESDLPSLGEEYAEAGLGEPERCPSPRDLKPINQITHRIAAEPGLFPQECALSDAPFAPRNFSPVTYTWKASALCHKPLYFQQPKLERYGHTFGPVLSPIISIGHFFVMVPCLPYNMGLEPPWECVYPLGWFRPGDCAPYTLGPVPLSLRGAAVQGFITTGLWFLFP